MRFLFFLGLMIVVLSLFVVAQPSLENEQFYGKVYWDKGVATPSQVLVKVGSSSFTSSIKDVTCTDFCSGTYGYTSANILRVQADQNGAELTFYVDTIKVLTQAYKPGESVELALNLATVPIIKEACKPEWQWGEWSVCVESKQSRTGTDKNKCDPQKLNATETQACTMPVAKNITTGNASVSSNATNATKGNATNATVKLAANASACTMEYACSGWSSCVNGQQKQSCSRVDTCDEQFKVGKASSIIKQDKPSEVKVCVEVLKTVPDVQKLPVSAEGLPPEEQKPFDYLKNAETCFDKVKNQDEVDVDCGGVCPVCQESSNMLFILLGIVVVLLGGGGAFYYFRTYAGLAENVVSTLDTTFQRGEARGMSEGEIAQKLADRGWDDKVVTKYVQKYR